MDSLAHLFIRHPRAQYTLSSLGPSRFHYDRCEVIRKDFEIEKQWVNSNDNTDNNATANAGITNSAIILRGSCFLPSVCCSSHCIVYMHGSAGCRQDAFSDFAVEIAICCRLPIVCFDFAGAGLSDGEYISLGFCEQDDVACVINYLKANLGKWISAAAVTTTTTTSTSLSPAHSPSTTTATLHEQTTTTADHTTTTSLSSSSSPPPPTIQQPIKFCLWGRSMGAVAALLFSISHPSDVCGLILDSPFSHLWTLSEHLIKQWYTNKPVFFADTLSGMTSATALPLVRTKILSLIPGFDIKEFSPLSFAPRACVPVLFVHGKEDTFVPPLHSQLLYEAYGKEAGAVVQKRYCLVDGTHNERRPPSFLEEVLDFLRAHSHARPGRRYFPALFQPVAQNGNFGLAVVPFLKENSLSGEQKTNASDDFSAFLPDSLSSSASSSTTLSSSNKQQQQQNPPFRRDRILCVHSTQGLSLLQPLTGNLEFSLPYEQIAKFGVLDGGGEGVYVWSQLESEARMFWCEAKAAKEFQVTVAANIEALIQEQMQGGKEKTRQKMLGNVEYAATTLIDAEISKALQPELCKITFSLCDTMAEVLGPEQSDPLGLCRDIAQIVLRVAQKKLKPSPTLTPDEIVQRYKSRNELQKYSSKQSERRKSCLIT